MKGVGAVESLLFLEDESGGFVVYADSFLFEAALVGFAIFSFSPSRFFHLLLVVLLRIFSISLSEPAIGL